MGCVQCGYEEAFELHERPFGMSAVVYNARRGRVIPVEYVTHAFEEARG